ncbi:MAG: DNA repair protein [Gammaproteobacteria bacterium]|nr:DNA repair protein [Gammaproteobacteria bacterium]MBU2240552.1 DNA repair protein [Gammaproteobacteria bacterium]MBU2320708.1 DNA repair protein [Gammaproteobacteria bacterium]MBU2415051.1 DNA repair protein [Gammaproteobacteria bacterium]
MFSWGAKLIKKAVKAVANVVTSAVKSVKKTCSKVWNAFTGKHYTDEAESILDEAKLFYEQEEVQYKAEVQKMSAMVECKISHINACKEDIYDTHFQRFISVASRLHNVTVKGIPFEELFDESVLEVKNLQGVRTRSDIIKIDFDNMSIWQTAAMILTLGFGTRKKAKESLENAKQERKRVDEEIAKMNSQRSKLKVIVASIDQVVEYFDTLISSYVLLLDRFEYGIQTQRIKQMSKAENVFCLKLDFKKIPIVHIEEFQALFNLSIVLKQMATLGYLSEKGEIVKEDMDRSEEIIKIAKTAALCA